MPRRVLCVVEALNLMLLRCCEVVGSVQLPLLTTSTSLKSSKNDVPVD